MSRSKLKSAGILALSVLFWVIVWWITAKIKDLPLLFPSPIRVFSAFFDLLGKPDFYRSVFRSVGNILLGTLLATLAGILLAILSHRFPAFRSLILPPMTLIKTTPVASFIVLLMIWIGSETIPSLITALIVLPVVWNNLDTGLGKTDPELLEMAKVYHVPGWKTVRKIILPSVSPYFISACRTSLGLAWKAGIAAEIITRPDHVIGTRIGEAKDYIDAEGMFAWTLTVILISLLIEFGFVRLLGLIPTAARTERDERRGSDAEH